MSKERSSLMCVGMKVYPSIPLYVFDSLKFYNIGDRNSDQIFKFRCFSLLCCPLELHRTEKVSTVIFTPNNYPHRICIAIAYFAVSLNTVNLHGNSYLNCFLSATVELPAYVLSWIMFRRCSRRLCLFSTLFTTGLFLLFVQLMPASMTLSKTELCVLECLCKI